MMNSTMKKILCPCDFSMTSLHGIEYAASIAQQINAMITLCHIQPSIWPETVFLEPIVEESTELATEKMETIANNISRQFGIKTNHINPRSTDTVEGTIGDLSDEYDLIIMGTNGVDDTFQFIFGSTSFNVAKNAACPILLIPENWNNQLPEGIVYIHHESINPDLDILAPVWWSQMMNIPFGIWILSSGDELEDRQQTRTISEELKTGGPENLISFVEIHPGPNRKSPRHKWIHALAINHLKTSSKNSGIKMLRKWTSTIEGPLLVFGVSS